MSKNEVQELKNIKYKNMLLSGINGVTTETQKTHISSDASDIDLFLEKEINISKNEPWSKLDKNIKLKKLNDYANEIGDEYELTPVELKTLKKDLSSYIDKKQLQKVKDVTYDKENGVIKNIPNLKFNKNTRKFTIKKSDKHVSTTKSLGPKKNSSTKKNLSREKKEKIDTA
jgi:hypothetical protein